MSFITEYIVERHSVIKVEQDGLTEDFWDVYIASSPDNEYYYGKAVKQNSDLVIGWKKINDIFKRDSEMIKIVEEYYDKVTVKEIESV